MQAFKIAVTLLAAGAAVPALAQMGPPDPYGDKTVTKAEAEAQAIKQFVELDTNKDGSLTPEERRTAGPAGRGGARGPGGPGGRGAAGPMNQAGYVAAQLRRFEAQDADNNGQLTKAERDAFRQQMMQRFQGGGR